jgi:LPXTG-motif cell wall-anchored protein
MRRTIVVGLTIATLLLLGQALVTVFGIGGNAYASTISLSDLGEAALQTTRTATPGTLPETGGEGGLSLLILGAGALVMLGAAVLVLVSSRRSDSSEV